MSAFTQETRRLALETPLGKDALLLNGFTGQEDMSRLFSYDLDLMSEKDTIAAKDIVGKNVTFWVEFADGTPRHFNGFVSRFSYLGKGDRLNLYRAEVVPWLWFLTKTTDCRIFQNKSVPDIIKKIFSDLGFSDFKTSEIKGKHEPWEYCVQYRETDFNFVSRLMEEEGIFYFFQHEKGKHTLILSDQKGAYKEGKEKDVEFQGNLSAPQLFDLISHWEHRYEFRTGKFAQTDYNFLTPTSSLMANTSSVVKLDGNSKFEYYEFPGQYEKKAEGDNDAKLRMEEEEARYDTVYGEGHCRGFSPGVKFKLSKHHNKSEEGKSYVVTSVHHRADMGGAYTSGVDPGQVGYQNSFYCMPDSVPFRPARVTPKPLIHGSQTAVVVGPSGEEIYPDKYSRVKVQFHWDREGKKDEHSSCWIRVSQPWAGKQWGAIHIPRIGQEVVVSHLEGDPDRPLITGMVYNADMMPPYALPDNKTQTGIKTRSSKGGGSANFNEIRFEDKKGSEELYFHAEKDQNIIVEHDRTEFTGNDRRLSVIRDKYEDVGRNKAINIKQVHTETIGESMNISVGANLTENVAINYAETVGAAMQLSVGAALAITVGAAMAETVGAAKIETIGAAKSENIGGGKSVNVGGSLSETVKKDRIVKISKDLKEEVGGQHKETVTKEYILQAKKIQMVAEEEICIKTGSAEIVMKKNGDISIKGGKINVKGSGDIVMKGSNIKEN